MIRITDTKGQNKKALFEILHVDMLRKEYADALSNMSYLGAQNLDGMPHGTGVGNPTLQKAVKLTDIENKKNWIMAIEQMESTLNEKHRAFLHIRRNAEKHSSGKGCPWVAYTQAHYNDWYYERFGSEICISEDTLKVWQARIVDKTVRFAIYYGCFAV
jgi:hypothetical protein